MVKPKGKKCERNKKNGWECRMVVTFVGISGEASGRERKPWFTGSDVVEGTNRETGRFHLLSI